LPERQWPKDVILSLDVLNEFVCCHYKVQYSKNTYGKKPLNHNIDKQA